MPRTLRRCAAICVCALLGPGNARADGAFPNAQNILVPAGLPDEIALATNFGWVSSIDDGRTWLWTCEQPRNAYGSFYQFGAPPLNRLFAVSSVGLVFSDDNSCGWTVAGGALVGASVLDVFPDPTNPNRVLALIAQTTDAGATTAQVVESSDAGATFDTVRYTAAGGDHLTGIEIARDAPATLYFTLTSGTAFVPKLGRSADGGMTWTLHDLSAALGAGTTSLRLVAVDPEDAQRVFMRVGGATGEQLAVTTDGGETVTVPLIFPSGVLSAFTRAASGALIAAGVIGVAPVAFRSTDDGATFQALPAPPALDALAARGGTVYGALDDQGDYLDGPAIVTSVDDGTTWQPLMSYDQIQAIQGCAMAACQSDCLARANTDPGQWSTDFCAAAAPDATDGAVTSPADGAVDQAPDGAGPTPPERAATAGHNQGCACAVERSRVARPGDGLLVAAFGAAALVLTRRRRARRRP